MFQSRNRETYDSNTEIGLPDAMHFFMFQSRNRETYDSNQAGIHLRLQQL